ncbi:MAG: efflux RND transporter permease subunit [Rikenellaceae bacterium]|nr:efflux RND transporter permease subunit [Rikenellaceae bacterium]
MKLTRYSLNHPGVVWFFMLIMLIGGVVSFFTLGKKEDSPFVIKSAVLTVHLPGASPSEVEQLLTEPIESEMQGLRGVDNITSESHFGYARITVELRADTPAAQIPQMWDELRRKALNVQSRLPSEASTIEVTDDFGDVYGLYYGLTAEQGITYEELRAAAKMIQRRMVTLPGVAKVTLFGEQSPVIEIRMSRARLTTFAVRPEAIIEAVGAQNTIVDVGERDAGDIRIKVVEPTAYATLEDIGAQLLMSSDGRQVALSDIATIHRRTVDPPAQLMRVDGRRAIGIGISTERGSDVVATGAHVADELQQLREFIPLGVDIVELYPEDKIAREANNRFIINLLESVAIVVLIVMLTIGLRAGVSIGMSLLLAIGGTLLLMGPLGEGLNRTSLAGFIIAMGMLVDNAIVVTDNTLWSMRRGVERRAAAMQGVRTARWGLLGATLIAVLSFLPLYLADSSVSEIVQPLFVVMAVSLLLSWVLALTQVPMMNNRLLTTSAAPKFATPKGDGLIGWCIRHKWLTVVGAYLLLGVSLVVLGAMPKDFFPNLDKPYFRADVNLPDGYDIDDTERTTRRMERWLTSRPEVKRVSVTMGATPPRYYLASGAVSGSPSFANLLVEMYSRRTTARIEREFTAWVRDSLPDVWIRSSLFRLSPTPEAAIEFGFSGPSVDTLIMLTEQTLELMRNNDSCVNIRSSWGNKVPVWRPVYSQARGTRLGISRSDMARYMTLATSGYTLGRFREGDRYVPIVLKDEMSDDYNLANMRSIPVFSRSGRVYPLEQTVSRFDFGYEFATRHRYNSAPMMMARCDPQQGVNTVALYQTLREHIERTVTIPDGYTLSIFGEQEGQTESNTALARQLPLTLVLIWTVLLLLFGDYRRSAVVLMTVPLIVVGLVFGLLITGRPFDFFSLLGLLGLVGMNIKNGVILVDSVGRNADYQTLVNTTQRRVLPVCLASGTTVLGMLPLAFDSMFGSMAVGIMGGLIAATILTVLVLPACYAIWFGINKQ